MAKEIRADPGALSDLADASLAAAERLGDHFRTGYRHLPLPVSAFGTLGGAAAIHGTCTLVLQDVQTAVTELVAVLEGDAERLLRTGVRVSRGRPARRPAHGRLPGSDGMTTTEAVEAVAVDDLWRLEARPDLLDAAAGVWRATGQDAAAALALLDAAARPVSGAAWTGDAAESYQWHRVRLGRDLDTVARLGPATAERYAAMAALLRRGQDLLDDAWGRIAALVPHRRTYMSGKRVRTPGELTEALIAAIKANKPHLIHVPVGPMPDPWKFVHLPRVRG